MAGMSTLIFGYSGKLGSKYPAVYFSAISHGQLGYSGLFTSCYRLYLCELLKKSKEISVGAFGCLESCTGPLDASGRF